MIYTYKIRLYPTKGQQILLHKHFGARKWVYNNLLAVRKQEYLENKKGMTFTQICAWIKMRKDTDMWWLKEINSQSLQQAAKDLDGAYGNFFKRNADFPKFVSKFDK